MLERIRYERLDHALKNGGVPKGSEIYNPGNTPFWARVIRVCVLNPITGLTLEIEPGRHYIVIDPHSMENYYVISH